MKWGFDEKGFWLTNSLRLSLLLWVLLLPNQTQAQTNSCLAHWLFFSVWHMSLSHVTQLSITYNVAYILWNQLCWLGLAQPIWDARCLAWTLELKDRLSDWEVQEACFTKRLIWIWFWQSSPFCYWKRMCTITQTIWFFEVSDLNDMSLKCPSCVLQFVFRSFSSIQLQSTAGLGIWI